ncbi:MAG: tetratricopeptide repeat protein [Candidatus Paceibacterota bacterium]
MIKSYRKSLKQNKTFFLSLVGTLFMLGSFFLCYNSPLVLSYLGNVTFGGSPPKFYSLPIAKFAYMRSSELRTSENKPIPWSNYQLGRIAFITGDLSIALEYFNKELEYYPLHTKVYYMKGLTLGYIGREEEGIEAFKFYTKNTNDTWASFNDLAWLQFRIGDIKGALETIEPIAKAQDHNPWIANTYGVLLMNVGRLLEAQESFAKGEETLSQMSEKDWGVAYPGNNPRIYRKGLSGMRESFSANQKLVKEKIKEASTTKRSVPK